MKKAIILVDSGKGLQAVTPVMPYPEARERFRAMRNKPEIELAELWTDSGRVKRIRARENREIDASGSPMSAGYPSSKGKKPAEVENFDSKADKPKEVNSEQKPAEAEKQKTSKPKDKKS